MIDTLLWLTAVGAALNLAAIVLLWLRVSHGLKGVDHDVREELRAGRDETRATGRELREEVSSTLRATHESMCTTLEAIGDAQKAQLEVMTHQLKDFADGEQTTLERVRTTIDSRFGTIQESNERKLDDVRKGLADGSTRIAEELTRALAAVGKTQADQLLAMTDQVKALADRNHDTLERIRTTLDGRVKELQESNERKLDEMRRMVDEKLHETLEKRLGDSFKLVSERLEAVHAGLGEMQTLASGVGDLKRVLTNVKARGTWAEVQLGAILEQILAPEQYETNVRVKPESGERVEYAVRLPGPKDDPGTPVWLPIDAKFPQEDYQRLQEAADRADAEAVQAAADALARSIRSAAKDIHDKYVSPPNTTDFAIMFLATEGLYAEALRQPALVEDLQVQYRVILAGPTTLVALLSSLRMGFQTLAIEQRASEVWRVLGAIKTEFGKFGEVLDKVKRQLSTATRTIETTGRRTRAIEKKLRAVEELPASEASHLLALPGEALDAEPAGSPG